MSILTCTAILLAVLCSAAALAQPLSNDQASAPRRGSVTGRVIAEDGRPVPNATVYLLTMTSGPGAGSRTALSDEEGNFRFTDLAPRAYALRANAPGYVSLPDSMSAFLEQPYYRLGDAATINLVKGGVITGRVTNSAGEPVIAAMVNAILIRDAEGRPVRGLSAGRARQTDDRGIYRLYGLSPGTYLVAVNGGWQPSFQASPYDGEAPTYYPSSTRDTAAEVTLQSSEEVGSIDIRYRGERGHAVSGKVTGAVEGSTPYTGITTLLIHVSSGAMVGNGFVRPDDTSRGFAFYGVPDGEYDLLAQRYDQGESGAASPPRRVTVRGADVTGLELALSPLGELAGRVVVEAASSSGSPAKCEKARPGSFEEVVFLPRRDEKGKDDPSRLLFPTLSATNEKGEFMLRHLEAGRYRLEARSLSESWYVRAIRLPGAAIARAPVDAARNGIALRSGERLTGLTVTLAEGAASVRGKVVSEKDGVRLPSRLRLHLVPVEAAAADDVVRYAETLARGDGTFAFGNLAPGRYWLLARPVPEDEPSAGGARPAAWDQDERAKLRREAEAAKGAVELQPCQRLSDFVLKHSPPTPGK